jgi:hypothetical protein
MMNRTLLPVTIVLLLAALLSSMSQAGVIRKGMGGALSGAALGSLVDGKKGAKTGAIIGGAVGVLGGAAEASQQQQQEEARKRQEAERQRAIQEQQQQEIEALKAQQAAGADNAATDVSSTTVLEIQKSLLRLGYDPGDIDGNVGPATESAIRLYETKFGLLETGRPSPELLKHMLRNGG